jgi:hypothetical protein
MNHLDEELRSALRREEPPAGFAERILDRLPAAPSNVVDMPVRGRSSTRFALAAAAALAVATGSVWLAIPHSDIQSTGPNTTVAVAPAPADDTKPVTSVVEPPTNTGIVMGSYPPRSSPPRRHVRVAPAPVPSPAPEAQDEEAIRAAEQLQLALHLTNDKLNVARQELRETAAVPSR